MGITLSDGAIANLNNAQPANQNAQLGSNLDLALSGIQNVYQTPFGVGVYRTVKLTAAAAGTAVPIVANIEIPTGQKFYLSYFIINVNGATAWTDATATKVSIWTTDGTTTELVKVLKAQLTANVINMVNTASLTIDNTVLQGTGVSQGIMIKADANFGAGSDIYVTVFGKIK